MPAATGTITIDGKTYTWTSPTLAAVANFEAMIGPVSDLKTVNSVRGRCYLVAMALEPNHPELTAKNIMDWPISILPELWPLIKAAYPIWNTDEEKPNPPASPDSSSNSELSTSAGPQT